MPMDQKLDGVRAGLALRIAALDTARAGIHQMASDLDQVRRILKSFGMHFAKPYPRDHRRPADAKTLLKKNSRG